MWFLILFILLSSPTSIIGQESTSSAATATPTPAQEIATSTPLPPTPTPRLFDQYQKDYFFQYDQYQQDYLQYIDKKKVYTKYGTITTQKEKFQSAITAINSRNKAFKLFIGPSSSP
jgi:hypothetical protein